ncbi:MAG: hypothetical protein JW772_01640, partial [Candidatus Diapherotrites archaeon]|nr:hypothetical protein [Candidatus Diapherotrites archaeon]
MQTHMFSRTMSIALIFLLLNTSLVFAQENAVSSSEDLGAEVVTTTETAEFKCMSDISRYPELVLMPHEVEQLKLQLQNTDEPNGKPFTGQKRSVPGTESVSPGDRGTLENAKAVLPTGVGQDAVLADMPSQKFDPSEMPGLDMHNIGPFAMGVSLDDTLRVGRCANLQSQIDQNSCPITDKRLEFRNSGTGIKGNVSLVWDDLKDWIGVGPEMNEQYTDEQTEERRAAVITEPDPEQLNYNTFKRIDGDLIENSIKSQSFSSEMGTTCQNAACVLNS